jgi:DNA-binding transcriptional LysR family regulator
MATPTFRQIRTFLAVVETGGISSAAHLLNLTQPAASQQLRELERCLRVRLLDRAGGRSVPTSAGTALLEPARRAQTAIEDAMAAAAAHRSGETGRVRLGTGATACIHLLPAVLAMAKRRMSGLEVTVATGNSGGIIRQVEAGELDLGLVTLPIPASRTLSITRLMTDPLVALIPKAMIDGDQETIGVAQLAAMPLILYDQGGSTRALIDGWFRRAGVTPVPAMQLDSVESIKVLVAGGLGASIVPQLSLTVPVAGTVTRRLRPGLSRQLAVVVRREKVVDRALRVVTEALRASAFD